MNGNLSRRFLRSDSVIFPPNCPVWAIWHSMASTWDFPCVKRRLKCLYKGQLDLYWGLACCPFSGLVSLIVLSLALASWSKTWQSSLIKRVPLQLDRGHLRWLTWLKMDEKIILIIILTVNIGHIVSPGSICHSSYSPSAPFSPAAASVCHPLLPSQESDFYNCSTAGMHSNKITEFQMLTYTLQILRGMNYIQGMNKIQVLITLTTTCVIPPPPTDP